MEEEEKASFLPKIDEFCAEDTIGDLLNAAYHWEGSFHKDWWIEQIAARLGISLEEKDERGIPP